MHKCGNRLIAFGMEKSSEFRNDVTDVLKAVLIATLISLGGVLIFAIILKYASLSDAVILPVNIVIKLLSVLIGVFIGFKNPQNGILKGAIAGALYMLFTFLIFAALNAFKDVEFSWIDLITLPVAGAISGIIAVNVKRKKA